MGGGREGGRQEGKQALLWPLRILDREYNTLYVEWENGGQIFYAKR